MLQSHGEVDFCSERHPVPLAFDPRINRVIVVHFGMRTMAFVKVEAGKPLSLWKRLDLYLFVPMSGSAATYLLTIRTTR